MTSRTRTLVLIVLAPVVLYGLAKGWMYFQAKRAVDDLVRAASNQAAVRYADISTDLRGAVTVSGISVQPHGIDDSVAIDAVRIASDDPMLFLRGLPEPGQGGSPPSSLSFSVNGVHLPLSAELLQAAGDQSSDAGEPCAEGIQADPATLRRLGFEELVLDLAGGYRLDQGAHTIETRFAVDLPDIQSLQLSATLADVDVDALAQGGAPAASLGALSMALRIEPTFGHQVLKSCAIGTDRPVQAWSEALAGRAIADLSAQGVTLGYGIEQALRRFYNDWGELRVELAPAKPIGLLSLVLLPPEQLITALGVRVSANGQPVDTTGLRWERPEGADLSALFGGAPVEDDAPAKRAPARIIVRHEYIDVPVSEIAGHINAEVQIKPRSQPLRSGVLKRIADREVEIEQNLHGGKFSVYVRLDDIESLRVLVSRPIDR